MGVLVTASALKQRKQALWQRNSELADREKELVILLGGLAVSRMTDHGDSCSPAANAKPKDSELQASATPPPPPVRLFGSPAPKSAGYDSKTSKIERHSALAEKVPVETERLLTLEEYLTAVESGEVNRFGGKGTVDDKYNQGKPKPTCGYWRPTTSF
jgi:hypothetical protein